MSIDKSKFTQTNLKEDKFKILQTHFPESILVTEDEIGNKSYEIDSLKLQSFFNNGASVLVNTPDAPKDGYELSWVGKKVAYQDTFEIGKKVLKLEKSQSKNINDTENIVLIGDNIEVLKLLRQNYHNSIKCIYIDPPYNTGNDEFTYKDRFSETGEDICEQLCYDDEYKDLVKNMYSASTHSAWMSFMLSRLLLAKELLKEDGVIFISIDDNEQAQLKLLCDEVFGESNFVGQWNWFKSATPPNLSKKIKKNIEYILCYQKGGNDEKFKGIQKTSSSSDPLTKPQNTLKKLVFPPKTLCINITDGMIEKGIYGTEQYPNHLLIDLVVENHTNQNEISFQNTFVWTQNKLNEELDDNTQIYLSKNLVLSYKKQDYDPESPPSLINDKVGVTTTENAGTYLEKLFNSTSVFDYPKPVDLIKYLANFLVNQNDIILDFFAGSGTTGDAVMQLNAEDGGNRKFILVQLDSPIDPKKSEVAYKFCADNNLDPVISSITIERLNRAGDKILEKNLSEKPELKDSLDIGYKVFSIHDDPESKFLNSDISEYDQINFSLEYSKIKNDPEFYTKENLIYNAYIYNNIPLSITYKILKDSILYQAENHYFCFGEISRDELEQYLNKNTEGVFTVFCGEGYVTDSFIHTCEAHLMQIAPNITYKVHG